jgi:hypothetical protein
MMAESRYLRRTPTRRGRLFAAVAVALIVGGYLFLQAAGPSDFSLIRFGAEALLHGADPYRLAGKGLVFDSEWAAFYPATAYVVGIPFTLLGDWASSIVFSVLSTFILAYAITRDGWHRMPVFLSVPFFWAAVLAQWSILVTAMMFLPWLAIVAAAKPQAAIPVVLAAERPSLSIKASLGGGIVLVALSLALLPAWPLEWLGVVRRAGQIESTLFSRGGFLILPVLLRWRDRDAHLILLMSLVPQAWYPYSVLPILAIARTFRESLLIVATSTLTLLPLFITGDSFSPEYARMGRLIVLAGVYLPAVLLVLTRSRETRATERTAR